MENYMGLGMKLKRKDLDEVNDDFSDFSLSSPARKIRRLDAELPPIIEEEEAEIPLGYEHSVSERAILNGAGEELKALDIEELPFVPENEEKAIVPFNSMNDLLHSATNYSVDPNLIACFKNQAILGAHLNAARPNEDEAGRNGDDREVNTCRAVIPWVPSQHLDQRPPVPSSQNQVLESMDAEEMEEATMEIENDSIPDAGQQVSGYFSHPTTIDEGFQRQWQQQHCMIPQPPQNVTTPLVWYR